MKIQLLLLILSVALVAGCKKDDIPDGNATLKYDGGNATGPLLDAGYHELGVYFPSSTMGGYTNWKLTEVTFFMGGLADSVVVKIYDEGGGNAPGSLLYEKDVTGTIVINEWQEHLLPTPMNITGAGVWVCVGLKHNEEKQSIGCDSGPNNANGDWIYQDTDLQWLTYVQRTGESVNWNIRAVVEE